MINVGEVDLIVFDFDGVLTDNRVYVSQNGDETVKCNRSDGLGFDVLKKLEVPVLILSTEKNAVVLARAKKLGVSVINGVDNKLKALNDFAFTKGFLLQKTIYVGNDLNDFYVMKACGFLLCPNDSHPRIKEISQFILSSNGGEGVVRELVEDIMSIDVLGVLF